MYKHQVSQGELALNLTEAIIGILLKRRVIGINDLENLIARLNHESDHADSMPASVLAESSANLLRQWVLEITDIH